MITFPALDRALCQMVDFFRGRRKKKEGESSKGAARTSIPCRSKRATSWGIVRPSSRRNHGPCPAHAGEEKGGRKKKKRGGKNRFDLCLQGRLREFASLICTAAWTVTGDFAFDMKEKRKGGRGRGRVACAPAPIADALERST